MGAISADIIDDVVAFTTIDEDLSRADDVQTDVQKRRQGVIEKLETMVQNINYENVPEKAGDAMAKMMPITTFLTALKDQESSARQRAVLKLRKQDADQSNDIAGIVAEFLRKPITQRLTDLGPVDFDGAAKEFEEEVESSAPIMESELRTDPTDLE